MKTSLIFPLLVSSIVLPFQAMCQQPPNACEEALQARLDCYDTTGPCDTLPIPPSSFATRQPDPNKGYLIETLRDGGIYAIGEGSYWMMAAVAPMGRNDRNLRSGATGAVTYEVVVFDAPEGSFVVRDPATGQTTGSLITNALDEIVFEMHGLTPEDIASVKIVYSHQHMDHVGGATIVRDHIASTWMPSKLDVIGTKATKEEYEHRIAADFFSFRAPVPTVVVDDEEGPQVFSIGTMYEFSLTPLAGHTAEKDLVVFFETDAATNAPAILMYVDVVFPAWAPFFSFAITTDIFHYLEAHDYLLDNFDLGEDGIFVGGHLNLLGKRSDIETSKSFAQAVMAGAQKGLQEANVNAIAVSSGVGDPTSPNLGNSWLLSDLYFKEVVKICAKKVVAEWGCKIAAVDVTIDSHCRSAQSYWRVDY